MELVKAPTVKASLPFALSQPSTFTDVAQVLDNNGSSRLDVLHNALGEDVIVVFSLPKQFARKVLQVPFSRPGTTFLQLSTEAEHAAFLFLPSPLTQKMAMACDGWAVQTQVHANHFTALRNGWSGNGDDDVEEITSPAHTQVSTTDLATNIRHGMLRNAERAFHTSCYCSKTGSGDLPLHAGGSSVIADTGDGALWATNRLELRGRLASFESLSYLLGIPLFMVFLPRESRLHGFSGFDTSGTHQLSRQVRELCTQWVVGLLMQFDAIAALRGKPDMGHLVEARGMLLKRSFEDASLLRRGIELYHRRSIHVKSRSYMPKLVKRRR